MAESHEQLFEELVLAFTVAYAALAHACTLLPIPVRLPEDVEHLELDEIRAAVHTAAMAVTDEPIDALPSAALSQGLIHWIGAGILVSAFAENPSPATYDAAKLAAHQAAAGAELVISLLGEMD